MKKILNKTKLIVGFSGKYPEDGEVQQIRDFILQGQVQGVIIFSHNIEGPGQLRALTQFFRKANEDIIVAVDQEGGAVQRLRKDNGFTDYPSAKTVSLTLNYNQAKLLYSKMAQELKSFGINFNFAPCVDINPSDLPLSPIIGGLDRSYGSKFSTILYATAFIEAHKEKGVETCLKHYPGHGSAQGDTHEGFVDVSGVWREEEIDVFKELIQKTDVSGVMSAHISHLKWENKPATFEKKIIQKLKKDYNFTGTVFCDDLNMGAILEKYTFEEALSNAFSAGIDGFIYSSNIKATGGHSFLTSLELIPRFWILLKNNKQQKIK